MIDEDKIIEELKENILIKEKKFQVLSDMDNYGALGFARGELSGYEKAIADFKKKILKFKGDYRTLIVNDFIKELLNSLGGK